MWRFKSIPISHHKLDLITLPIIPNTTPALYHPHFIKMTVHAFINIFYFINCKQFYKVIGRWIFNSPDVQDKLESFFVLVWLPDPVHLLGVKTFVIIISIYTAIYIYIYIACSSFKFLYLFFKLNHTFFPFFLKGRNGTISRNGV